MVNSSKDIQLSELRDLVSQLNTTIKTLNDTPSPDSRLKTII